MSLTFIGIVGPIDIRAPEVLEGFSHTRREADQGLQNAAHLLDPSLRSRKRERHCVCHPQTRFPIYPPMGIRVKENTPNKT